MSNRYLSGNFAPVEDENESIQAVIIQGNIPEELQGGQYIKNGPNPQLDFKGKPYHWFDGDGMVHGIYFKESGPVYTNKYIKTPKYLHEKIMNAAVTAPIGALLSDSNTKASVLKQILIGPLVRAVTGSDHCETTSNTAITFFGGRLLATNEGDVPMEFLSPSLDTIGLFDFNKQLTNKGGLIRALTAHPKFDPATGEFLFFGYDLMNKHSNVSYSLANKAGTLLINRVDITGCRKGMFHDFGITKNYSVIIDSSIAFDQNGLFSDTKKGLFYVDHDRKINIAVFPRYIKDESDVMWFNTDITGASFHVANAYETIEHEEVVILAYVSKDLDVFQDTLSPPTKIHGFVLLSGDIPSEFPVINPKNICKTNQYIWSYYFDPGSLLLTSGILKTDLFTNSIEGSCTFGAFTHGSELSFVPKKEALKEDDGFLVGFVFQREIETYKDSNANGDSYFVVYDADSLDLVCKIMIPVRIPYGFHGFWLSREDIESQVGGEILDVEKELDQISDRLFGLGPKIARMISNTLSS